MRILTFTTLFPNNVWPNHGVFTKERLLPLLRRGDCSLAVVAPVPYHPPIKLGSRWAVSQVESRQVIEGLDVYHPRYFMTPKVGMTSYGLLMFLSALPTVRRIRKEFNFDLIDAQFVYPDGFAGVLLGRYFGRPVVTTSHGTDLNLYPSLPMIRPLLRYTLERSSKAIAVCQALKAAMVRLNILPEKISVVPNGADLDKFYPLPREEARKRLGLPDSRLIISVGQLIPRKGHDLLLRSLRLVIDQYLQTDVFLLIVGDGPSRAELENLITSLNLQKHARLVGPVPHQELNLWFNAADLFCLTSSREGWPCVLVESLAAGTPAVATDIWGNPEVICSEKFGLTAALSEADIAQKISLALKTPWDRDTIVRYARGFTWKRSAESALEVFRSAISGFDSVRSIRNIPGTISTK